MVGDGQGDTGTQQQRGVDGGQPERRHGGEGLDDVGGRRGHASGQAGPDGLEIGPEQRVIQASQGRHRVRASPPERREERAKKHHLGEDEPAHAPAEGQVNLNGLGGGVMNSLQKLI